MRSYDTVIAYITQEYPLLTIGIRDASSPLESCTKEGALQACQPNYQRCPFPQRTRRSAIACRIKKARPR